MKNNEMQKHLIGILSRFSMRKDLVHRLYVNLDTYEFRDDISEEDKWGYYIWVCKELKIKDRIMRSHGMNSEKASAKKIGGHNDETFFEQFGLEVQKGNNKTDLRLNGLPYASLKGGVKIQWGMHVINNLPKRFQNLFSKWISSYEKNSIYLEKRSEYAEEIVNLLDNKETRKDFINYYFRKEENIPFLIVKDVYEDIYYRIDYVDLINVLVDNLEFYITKGKVKINARIEIGEKQKRSFFDIEPRTDKDNTILMHGLSERVIKVIKYYKIDVKEIYKQNPH
jgi:hypothetical protein